MKICVAVAIVVGAARVDAAPSAWVGEIVDYNISSFEPIVMRETKAGTAIMAASSPVRTQWLVRGANGWADTLNAEHGGIAVALDKTGTPAYLFREHGGALTFRIDKRVEKITTGIEISDVASLAFDAAGNPHVCIATEQVNVGKKQRAGRLAYATRKGKTWVVEKLAPTAFGCTIAVAGDGAVWIGHETGAIVASAGSAGTPRSWQDRPLGGETVVERLPDGNVVAVTAKGTSVVVSRDGATVELAKLAQRIWKHVIAIDAQGRVHAAIETRDPQSVAEIFHAVEGTAGTTSIANVDADNGFAIVIDAAGEPVVAYSSMFAQKRNQTLIVARRRAGKLASSPPFFEDVDAMLAGCVALISDELGTDPVLGELPSYRPSRLCEAFFRSKPLDVAALEQRCKAGSANACLVAAIHVGGKKSREAPTTIERLHVTPCTATLCTDTFTRKSGFGQRWSPFGKDDVRATELLRKACELGMRAACLQAQLATDATDLPAIAKLCTPDLPFACALVVTAKLGAPELTRIRGVLETACKTSQRAVACNALAFMKDRGVGGGANAGDALRHHVRACSFGDGSSCARIVGRVPAPKTLEADAFVELLTDRCNVHIDDACLGLSTAYATGWVVKRDPALAKETLTKACDERVERACQKIGRKVPPRPTGD